MTLSSMESEAPKSALETEFSDIDAKEAWPLIFQVAAVLLLFVCKICVTLAAFLISVARSFLSWLHLLDYIIFVRRQFLSAECCLVVYRLCLSSSSH